MTPTDPPEGRCAATRSLTYGRCFVAETSHRRLNLLRRPVVSQGSSVRYAS